VREAFATNFAEEDEVGAAVAVHVRGRPVVDLWGGHRDRARRVPWERNTLVNAYSVGKGVLAFLVLRLVEQGRIDLDARVADTWPEFAAEGKGDVGLRTLLCHAAGLPAIRKRLPEGAMLDWDVMAQALAAQAPYWEPGSAHGYHCNTYGYLVGEVVRRATGLSVGDALHRELTGPLDADFFFGLPRSQHGRVSWVHVAYPALTEPEQWAAAFPATGDEAHDHMIWHTYFNPGGLSGAGTVNTPEWREAAIPSTNGHGTARGVARLYAALLSDGSGGPRPVSEGLLSEACVPHADGEDRVLGRPSRFGLGFQLTQPTRPLGHGERAFGHFGYGGSLGFGDPDAGVAFGYLMNRPGERWQTPRTQRLIDALYACL